jgi:hypothetical protein
MWYRCEEKVLLIDFRHFGVEMAAVGNYDPSGEEALQVRMPSRAVIGIALAGHNIQNAEQKRLQEAYYCFQSSLTCFSDGTTLCRM